MLTLQYDTHNVFNMYYTHITLLHLNYKKNVYKKMRVQFNGIM